MFNWFKKKPAPEPEPEPRITEAYRMICEAYRLILNAGYVMEDTKDWSTLPDKTNKMAVAKFYATAEAQTRYLQDEITLTLRRMPNVKVVYKGASNGK